MPYYHVHVDWKDEFGDTRWSENTDFSRAQINELVTTMKKKIPFILKKLRVNPSTITEMEIWKTEERAHGKSNIWRWIRHHGENVTNDFIITLPTRPEKEETEKGPSRETKEIPSKNVFIVHGRDHKPMKELKVILEGFGLKPIVLHEQPSGSMTIIEKLEKYSKDIGFAFILLTPDDALVPTTRYVQIDKKKGTQRPIYVSHVKPIFRARQNVILEFGFFIAKITRKKVCCLNKEDTALPYDMPSDMHGIVYIPFKESVNEVRDKIVKELKAAGYETLEQTLEGKKPTVKVYKKKVS